MHRLTTLSLTAALCSWGLLACTPQPGSQSDTTGKKVTLELSRLSNGDLEYCDENGDCTQVPYGGDCATVEIDVNTATGETCERCILDSGEAVDHGCGNVSIGCVLVTLPEPDCVVCAYVNGDVLFSSCVVEEPECTRDDECALSNGLHGACIDGQCVYEPDCHLPEDCPPGFTCAYPGTDAFGICVPDHPNGECSDNRDCPDDMYCEQSCDCWGTEPGTNSDGSIDSDAPEACECRGVCVPREPDPSCLSDADCPAGLVCQIEEICETCAGDTSCPAICEVRGVCVEPFPGECNDDRECPEGTACEQVCACAGDPSTDPDNSGGTDIDGDGVVEPCHCYGVCTPVDPPRECLEDADCPAGLICQLEEWCPPCEEGEPCPAMPCHLSGICVEPTQGECRTDADCPDTMMCITACWDCHPDDPNCVSGCEGWCVPREPEPQCTSDRDCPNGYCEQLYCDGLNCTDPTDAFCVFPNCDDGTEVLCDMIPPVCEPGFVLAVRNHCFECLDARSCDFEPQPECLSDSDCPEGLTCAIETYCPPCEDGDVCPAMPCQMWGYCVEPHPGECRTDADCPDDMACQVACWDCAPGSTDCQGGCEGWCVPREPQPQCSSNTDCAAGSVCNTCPPDPTCPMCDVCGPPVCEPIVCDFDEDCPRGSHCEGSSVCPPDVQCVWEGEPGICLPDDSTLQCNTDADCANSAGIALRCFEGICQ